MDVTQYKYKTELHLHTSPASGCSEVSVQDAVEIYSRLGYHSVVLTNHFYPGMRFLEDKAKCIESYLEDYDLAVKLGQKYGINVILGCEMRFTENTNDYLLFGIDKVFLDTAYESLRLGIAEFSKQFRNEERMIIQAHPFRNGMTEVAAEYLDGIEGFNMHPGHNSRNGFAAKYAKEHGLLITAGTDFHHYGHEGLSALLTKTVMKDSFDIVRVLKNGDYLLEISGSILVPYRANRF